MALPQFKSDFLGTATKGVAALGLALAPIGGATAQDAHPQAQQAVVVDESEAQFTQVVSRGMVSDASLNANRFSKNNPGVAVAVFLGTHPDTPSQERIAEILSGDFREAGLRGPVTFFFEQNDVAGSGAKFYFDGAVRGPFTLNESRAEVPKTTQSYNFRLERGLLASLDYNQ